MGNVKITKKATIDERKAQATLKRKVRGAIRFGQQLIKDFVEENVAMGITKDDMSEAVLDAMEKVEAAVRTGSLYVAIKRIREIPTEAKDAKYITDARLLEFINKIEEFLGTTISREL